MTRILCIGEAMAEIRSEGAGFAVGFAGDTFNTAVYCRRRLRSGSVAYLTRVAVSYTHLDVYKRQELLVSERRVIVPDQCGV